MSFKMNALPEAGRSEFSATGLQRMSISKVSLGLSKANNEQLTVEFKVDEDGSTLREFYQISDSNFMMYKLRRLVEAVDLQLGDAEITLQDLSKMIPTGTTLAGYLKVNENGYAAIDYSDRVGDGLGLVLEAEAFGIPEVPVTAAPETANDGPVLDITSDDLPFNGPVGETPTQLDKEIEKKIESVNEDF